MNSIPIPFAIGETVWFPGYGSREEWETCPDCAGSKVVTLIQGNGSRVDLACASCALGYEPPRGVIARRVSDRRPVPFTCGRVSLDGAKVRYSESPPDATAYASVDAEDLFRDHTACLARCAELNEQYAAEEERRLLANLQHNRRDMAWSARYWGRKVRELERDLALAKARLATSKDHEAVAR